jgi:putative two-component system response regulator
MERILAVDDSLASLQQIGVHLGDRFDVLLAKSGEVGIAICEKEKPDLVLLDVDMPGMDGFEVLARLKANPETSRIPVIFLTGSGDSETEIRALQSGVVDFITKPVRKNILYHRIELHLRFAEYQSHLTDSIQNLKDNVTVAFAELVACRDGDAGGHILRTCKYLEILARVMRESGVYAGELGEEAIRSMTRAASFHDIGKIGISDTILLKPGALTKEEYERAKRHTIIGEKFLQNLYERTLSERVDLKYAEVMAGGHHERYDGRGYPRGLVGDEIPLCCRILSVVNVYDACVTDRVYRPAMEPEAVREIIRRGRGTEFDPRVADVFDQHFETFATLKISVPSLLNPQGAFS